MVCGMLDNAKLISLSERETAIEEGILVPYQFPDKGEMIDCCFSITLWEQYRYSQSKLKQLCRKGMKLLQLYDEKDFWGQKRRVITADVWVIDDDDGLLFVHKKDY